MNNRTWMSRSPAGTAVLMPGFTLAGCGGGGGDASSRPENERHLAVYGDASNKVEEAMVEKFNETFDVKIVLDRERDGVEVVQLYLHDPVASVVRPVQRLIGYARVALPAGACARVAFTVPADVTSFTGRDGRRIVEPGALELRLAASSSDARAALPLTLTGGVRSVDHTRRLHYDVQVTAL